MINFDTLTQDRHIGMQWRRHKQNLVIYDHLMTILHLERVMRF